MQVQFTVTVTAEIPDSENIEKVCFGDYFGITEKRMTGEVIEYETTDVVKVQEE